ncbi:hypothetical protein [Bifidobacterium felsineum]|uniref:hypothetical protein n=1 Tax=Bifidobacterium felsineum TaxID=2045440 RepID=UPI001BDCA6C2|nr:hypothetical protein [Bifidobacterium felsineum]MBT1164957.1 hypothetical protein [Bifidobacterium felsineum]
MTDWWKDMTPGELERIPVDVVLAGEHHVGVLEQVDGLLMVDGFAVFEQTDDGQGVVPASVVDSVSRLSGGEYRSYLENRARAHTLLMESMNDLDKALADLTHAIGLADRLGAAEAERLNDEWKHAYLTLTELKTRIRDVDRIIEGKR